MAVNCQHLGEPNGETVIIERTQARCCSGGTRTGLLNFTVNDCAKLGRCLPHYTMPKLFRSERVVDGDGAQGCLTCVARKKPTTATPSTPEPHTPLSD